MKKSKILIPAVAVLALSVGASVTGTVAWFTSSRSATITAANFASVKLGADLSVEVTADAKSGTTVTGNAVSIDGNLTHGSYNAVVGATGSAYVASLNDDKTVATYVDLGTADSHDTGSTPVATTNKWLATTTYGTANNEKVWYAVSWSMSFKLKASTETEVNHLLFDVNDSEFKDSKNGNTVKGLRIALMSKSDLLVIGGDNELKHVKGTTASDVESFSTENYVAISETTAKYNDLATFASNLDLGILPSDGSALNFTVVAWFEGENTNVVDKINNADVVMSNVATTLSFYARKSSL